VQHQIERASVGGGELRTAAFVAQIEPSQRPQVARLAGGRPVDAAGEQRRLVQLEPVVADDLLPQIVALEGEHAPVIPVDIRPDHQLVVDITLAAASGVRAAVTDRAADELIAILRQHQIAAAVLQHIARLQLRGHLGPAIQMAPLARPHEGKQVHADGGLRRALTLQLQQQLAAQLIRLVLIELLEIQDIRAQPGHVHRRHDRAHAMLDSLGPTHQPAIAVDDGLFGGVVQPRPQFLQQRDIGASSDRHRCKTREQQHPFA